jgi:hypothetical protein
MFTKHLQVGVANWPFGTHNVLMYQFQKFMNQRQSFPFEKKNNDDEEYLVSLLSESMHNVSIEN